MSKLSISVTAPQAEFHSLQCKFPAFVGGYGSGKSETMCNQAIIDSSFGPDVLIALYAPTYDLCRLILAPRLLSKLDYFGIGYNYNKTEHLITTNSNQFGSFILKSLDRPEQIVGYESFRAHIDEIDVLKKEHAEDAWIKILGRNRQIPERFIISRSPLIVHPDFKLAKNGNKISAYSTPEGFNFLYDRWVLNKVAGYELVQAPSDSNPFLPADYTTSLRLTYPEHLVAAYLEGQFVNLKKGTVYKSFDRVIHSSNETIQKKDILYVGCDFNVTKQAATVYVRRNDNKEWHAVDELKNMYDTPAMISIFKERYAGHHIVVYPDASGISRKSVGASTSDIALLQQAGFEVRAKSKNPFVKDRVAAVNSALYRKLMFINVARCPTVTNCLEQQAYDDNGEPEKGTGKDHQNDATGYPIVYEMPIRRPITNFKLQYPA